MTSPEGLEMLERVRRICSALPEVEEIIDGFGHNTFKVKGKSFVIMGENGKVPACPSSRTGRRRIFCSSRAAL